MDQYKVKALSVGGLNKVFHLGEIVTEKDFPEGNFDKLIREKFIAKASSEDLKSLAAKKKAEEEAKAKEEEAKKKAEEEAKAKDKK